MPTDESVNASDDTAKAEVIAPAISDADISAHPKFKELEEKYAAARTGMDEANIKLKKTKEEKKELKEPQYVTTEALEIARWEIQNEKLIALAPDEYKKYRDEGLKHDYALKLAHQDKGISPSKSESLRQSASAQAGASVDRSGEVEVPDTVKSDAEKWGYSVETYKKYKDQVLTRR